MIRWLLPLLVLSLGLATPAAAWDLFTRENAHVAEGNRRMARNDAAGALREYDLAARELPRSPEVQLDRGLALLRLGQLDRAKEAFLRATEPPASAETRGAAYYDLGLAFYREGDQAAGQDQHEPAQRAFREAVDAFRRSLRARPGDANAAWNLELARRRLREQEREQQQQQNQQQQNQQQQQQQQRPSEPTSADAAEALPEDLRRTLEALESGEESLERERARARAVRERRRPVQDW